MVGGGGGLVGGGEVSVGGGGAVSVPRSTRNLVVAAIATARSSAIPMRAGHDAVSRLKWRIDEG